MDFTQIDPRLAGVVPAVWGIVAALKLAGVPSKYLPLCSFVVGIVGAFIFIPEPSQAILSGIALGAIASGLYDAKDAVLK